MSELDNRFKKYADLSPFAIMVYNSENWIYANDEAVNLTGFQREELYKKKFWEIVDDNFKENVKKRGQQRLNGNWPSDHYEIQLKRKDGVSIWIDLHLKKLVIDNKISIMAAATPVDDKKKAQEIYKTLTDNLQDGILLLDKEGKVEFINPIAKEILDHTENNCQDISIFDFFQYEHKRKLLKALDSVEHLGEYNAEFVFLKEDFKTHYEVHFKSVEFQNRTIVILHDISEREKAIENQKNLLKLQDVFINLITEIVKDKLDEGTYNRILKMALDVVPGVQAGSVLYKDGEDFKFKAAIGYDFNLLKKVVMTEEEIVKSKNPEILIVKNLERYNEDYLKDEKHQILRAAARNQDIFEMISIPIVIEGKVFAYFNLDNFEKKPLINDTSLKIANIFSTVVTAVVQKNLFEMELEKKNGELKKKSNYDPLTKLPNRGFLYDNADLLFKVAAKKSEKLYILYADLNKFKEINDSYGHDFGDRILAETGTRIRHCVRDVDLASRIGGDEFLLILTHMENIHLKKFLQRFKEKIEKPIKIDDKEFSVSASIGISVFPDDGHDFETLVKYADSAMYQAKNENINFSFHQKKMD
jgi:diguanylate cyclase (GGDEF)-like protein/PAS domain S-box-containing protein